MADRLWTPVLSKIAKIFGALIGVAALLVVGVALIPARAIKLATDRIDGLVLGATEGRLLRGEAEFAYHGHELGRLAWSVRPEALLDFGLGTDWQIVHPDYTMAGTATVGAGTTELAATGTIDALAANRFLAQYYISLDGTFEVHGLRVRLDAGEVGAHGRLRWSGGRAVYRVSGETHAAELPAMAGTLASVAGEPVFDVVTADDSLPLLHIRLDSKGWVHIGVTARLTSLAGNPWPGGTDDIVVTVSERLFGPADVPASRCSGLRGLIQCPGPAFGGMPWRGHAGFAGDRRDRW